MTTAGIPEFDKWLIHGVVPVYGEHMITEAHVFEKML